MAQDYEHLLSALCQDGAILASTLPEGAKGCHTLVIQRVYEPDPEKPGGPDAAQLWDLQPEHLV